MWIIKIIIKLLLSRLPVSYKTFNRIGIFRHGKMMSYEYAKKIFDLHIKNFKINDSNQNIIMELGVGDSLFSGIFS